MSNPGAITIHSIQNGAVEQTIAVSVPDRRFRVTGAWWFREEKKPTGTPLPEVFKRGENIVRRFYSGRYRSGVLMPNGKDRICACHFEKLAPVGSYPG